MLLFREKKSNKDSYYHSEMNWHVLSSWLETKVFPALQQSGVNSIVVLGRATYHIVLDEDDKYPVTSWNKNRICTSISRCSGPPDNWVLTWKKRKTNSELLSYAPSIYPRVQYKIQNIADKFRVNGFDIKILFLPVVRPELNPIEMV